jgi:hypothetical protein
MVQETLSRKKSITKKRAGGVAQGVGPEFKPQYYKKKVLKIFISINQLYKGVSL